MAKKNKFITVEYEQEKNPKKLLFIIGAILILVVIIIIVCVIAAATKSTQKENCSNNDIKLTENQIKVEINSGRPKTSAYFENMGCLTENNIEINDDNLNFTEIGTYEVGINYLNEEKTLNVEVVDTTAPKLTTKNVTINVGDTYTAKDFVEACTDNSGNECNVVFYSKGVDSNGYEINYDSYTEKGKYTIKIEASDEQGNTTMPVEATLYLGVDENYTPEETKCTYGSSSYDTTKVLSYAMYDNDCAIDPEIYEAANTREIFDKLINTETENLKTQFSVYSDLGDDLKISPYVDPIYNNENTGFIGVTIKIVATNGDKELISYYLNSDGTRTYINNPYEIK